jgi:hypothetical protein
MNVEGTWRAVGGHMEGKDHLQKSLTAKGNAAKITIAWRLGGKKKYREKCPFNALSQNISNNITLRPSPPHTPPLLLRIVGAL